MPNWLFDAERNWEKNSEMISPYHWKNWLWSHWKWIFASLLRHPLRKTASTHTVSVSPLLGLRCTSFWSYAGWKFQLSASWSLTPVPGFWNLISSAGIWSPFRLCTATASALHGPVSTSLDVVLPSLPCTLWPKKSFPRILSLSHCKWSFRIPLSTIVMLQKFDHLISTRCVFQMNLKTS